MDGWTWSANLQTARSQLYCLAGQLEQSVVNTVDDDELETDELRWVSDSAAAVDMVSHNQQQTGKRPIVNDGQ
jgi:hypothetical protein